MSIAEMREIELICVVINFGMGSKVLHAAKRHGLSGGTVMLGKGSINNKVLEFFGLTDIRKEVLLMVTDKNTSEYVFEKLNEDFMFDKPNHGIAFTTSVCRLVGVNNFKPDAICEERGAENNMYQAITVIVDRGRAEFVIEAATEAGSTGGTIINARGSGIHETKKLFAMEIEPEKEIVLILSEKEKTEAIVSSIRERLKIDEPGKGIIYVQDVNRTYGLFK